LNTRSYELLYTRASSKRNYSEQSDKCFEFIELVDGCEEINFSSHLKSEESKERKREGKQS